MVKYTSVSGIYIIINVKNGKIYIGQAKNIKHRWEVHISKLNGGYHDNRHLQSSWNKYGGKAFKFKILEYCCVQELNSREQHYLNIYMPKGICYNISKGAFSNEFSEETRKRMSESAKRRHIEHPVTPENRIKFIERNKARIVSDETKEKMRQSRIKYVKEKKEIT